MRLPWHNPSFLPFADEKLGKLPRRKAGARGASSFVALKCCILAIIRPGSPSISGQSFSAQHYVTIFLNQGGKGYFQSRSFSFALNHVSMFHVSIDTQIGLSYASHEILSSSDPAYAWGRSLTTAGRRKVKD
jgi:hypothetical protein